MALNRISASLNQTITIYSNATQDKFGKTTYGSGTDYPCRFEKVTKNIVTKQNELTPIDAYVFLDSNAIVDIGYKCRFASKNYKVMSVESLVDKRGRTRHYELNLQDWNL